MWPISEPSTISRFWAAAYLPTLAHTAARPGRRCQHPPSSSARPWPSVCHTCHSAQSGSNSGTQLMRSLCETPSGARNKDDAAFENEATTLPSPRNPHPWIPHFHALSTHLPGVCHADGQFRHAQRHFVRQAFINIRLDRPPDI